MKYRPEFPARFGSLEDARAFLVGFFGWYNHTHRHSGEYPPHWGPVVVPVGAGALEWR